MKKNGRPWYNDEIIHPRYRNSISIEKCILLIMKCEKKQTAGGIQLQKRKNENNWRETKL